MIYSKLKENGVMGMNRRLGEYILPYNERKKYPLVDCKIKTSLLAIKNGIPIPKHFFNIESHGQLREIYKHIQEIKDSTGSNDFVVKPAKGAMGNGVLIVEDVLWNEQESKVKLQTTRQKEISLKSFKYYLSDILGGLYSLNGNPDSVIVQERLKIHSSFDKISYRGIPDIRIIVFRGYPVMAMTRLPTKNSGGRANLHQGALGCGIDIKTGEITNAVYGSKIVEAHPDTGQKVLGFKVPHWEAVLEMSAKCFDVVGLGYLGIDIVIDPVRGPLLLEMNARPGLSIQTANLKGLTPRLEKIKKVSSHMTVKERLNIVKILF